MDYKQKYKEALERVRTILTDRDIALHAKEKFIDIFPELQENEDGENKRISKEITQFLKQNNAWNREWLAWLESRGEQKSTDNKKLDVLKFLRKETCCGLAEANDALLKLIKVLKEHPFPIMDKPHKLKIEWEEQK